MATVTGLTASKMLAIAAELTAALDTKVDNDALVINVKDHGAVGDGTTDDTAAIQESLNLVGPGGTVFLPPGVYGTNSPLTIPPQVRLLGSHGGHIDDVVGSCIKPKALFAGAAVILMVDQTTGGYSQLSAEQRIENLSIDGSNLSGSVDGIQAQGLVHGVYLTDVQVRHGVNHGVNTTANASGTAYSWRCSRVHVSTVVGIGITASMTDATWVDCEVIGAGSHCWFVGGASNSVFVGCRAEWSGLDGYNFGSGTGTAAGSGGPVFVGCTTDRNGQNGVSIPVGANGNAPVSFIGCTFRRDGRNSTSSGYAAVNVNASTQPVILSGCSVYPGTADDGTGNASPQYGLSAISANVQVNGGIWHAITEGIHNGGSNVRLARGVNTLERTGTTSSPVDVTRGIQTHGNNGDSLDVPGSLAGIDHPRRHGLAAWTYPPDNISAGKLPVAGTLHLAGMGIPRPLTAITKLVWGITTPGASPVSGQNWIGAYSSAGALLASINVDSRVATSGGWQETVSGLATLPDDVWIAFLFNAATMPTLLRASDNNGTLMNIGLANSKLKYATNGTGLTALPSTINPANNVSAQFSFFGAIG